ncbi:MAG: amidohydrolase family protein [Parafilimonas sp.]
MPFKKFQADYLFTGTEMLPGNHVLILNEHDYVEEIIIKENAGDDAQEFNGLISPGFVNCHCHLELSHMKGLIPEKTGLVDFVFKVVAERHFDDEEILEAIAKAEDEMFANGIVAAGDICNNTLTLSQKLKSRLSYYNFIEVSGWLPQIAEQRFQLSQKIVDQFNQLPTTNYQLPTALVPHAPYSVSDELWNLIQPFFTNKTISIHNQETSFEDELFIKNQGDFIRMYEMMKIDNSFFTPTGKSSLQSYFHKLSNAKNIILVHNTFTSQTDIDFANRQSNNSNQKLFFCICANANLYIEDKMPPIELLRKNYCNIVIGTDSYASNKSLNMLDEIKTILHHSSEKITASEILQWATINGAKALQMEHLLGSFDKGKQPGVMLIDKLANANITAESSVTRLL